MSRDADAVLFSKIFEKREPIRTRPLPQPKIFEKREPIRTRPLPQPKIFEKREPGTTTARPRVADGP